MKIEDSFRVSVPVEEAWNVLLDIERIAPCMPGAQLQEVEGDEYRGIVKVKVGPITAQYKGAARIVEADEANRKVVIKAEGRDTRGQGNASATVTATLEADGDATNVAIDTDLNVTGKVAQFGRGVMADVSSKLLGQFVTCVEQNVLSGGSPSPTAESSASAATTTPAPTTTSAAPPAPAPSQPPAAPQASAATDGSAVRRIDAPEAQPVDLMSVGGGAVAKRLVPVVIGAVVLGVVIWLVTKK